MYYVYFLQSQKDKKLYIGRCTNLERRLYEHNAGKVQSTKARRPFALLGFVEYETEQESVAGEREWKKGYKREELRSEYNI